MTLANEIKVTGLANWYGSNRTLAESVGTQLKGCTLVAVPFMGGACELLHIPAKKIVANDRHRHVINLARTAGDRVLGPQLYRRLRRAVFAPEVLESAQAICKRVELECEDESGLFPAAERFNVLSPDNRIDWAEAYFVSTWMGRGGKGGQRGEFEQGLSIRFDPDGGGSAQRYRNAVASLPAWSRVLYRCEFSTFDAFDFLAKQVDKPNVGVYCDPPFPGPGDLYSHQLGPHGQERLAKAVSRFTAARVVMRFYNHPLIRQLYPEPQWTWVRRPGRTQANSERIEVLLINGPS